MDKMGGKLSECRFWWLFFGSFFHLPGFERKELVGFVACAVVGARLRVDVPVGI